MGYGKIKIHRYEEELSYQSDIFITEEMKTVLIEGYGNVSCNNLVPKFSTKTGIFPSIWMNSWGYLEFKVGTVKKTYTIRLHRLVARAFIPNPYNLPEVNHKDGNKLNNYITNLELVTCKII